MYLIQVRAHPNGNQFSLLAWLHSSSPLQLAVLLLGQAALFRPGQRGSPASGLPAYAGALWDVPGERHAHWDFCPGNHHTGAPSQRSAQHAHIYMLCVWFLYSILILGNSFVILRLENIPQNGTNEFNLHLGSRSLT